MQPPTPSNPPSRPRVRRGNLEDAQRMRQSLLDAAASLFNEQGLDAITMRAVAGRIGVSPMAPYRYFSDKSDLLRGLWERVLQQLSQHIATHCEPVTDPVSGKAVEIESFLTFWETHPDEFALVYLTQRLSHQADPADPTPIPVYAGLLARFERSSLAYAAHHGLPSDRVRVANELVFIMQLGYLQAAMVNRRYPWSPLADLRATVVQQAMVALHRILAGTDAASNIP